MDFTTDIFGGGGAKGICQIPYFVKAEEDSKGIPYYKTRDLLVGTSIGGINAALMSTGKLTAVELSSLYKEMQTRVFTKKKWYEFPKTPVYDKNIFIEVWDSIIGNDFLMGDCKTKLMVTSINGVGDEFGRERNVFFKSWEEEDGNRRLVDVAVNTFSAPLYFGVTCRPDERRVYVDGGAGNNILPIDDALLESQFFGWDNQHNHLMVNAVGCLYSVNKKKQNYTKVCGANTLQQFLQFENVPSGGMARSMSLSDQIRRASYICKYNPNISFRYWDCEIPKKMNVIDGIKFLDSYETFGRRMISTPLISVN